MTNCIFNVNASDIDTFKKPGGGFIALERIKTLSTRNMSLPEHLSPKGYPLAQIGMLNSLSNVHAFPANGCVSNAFWIFNL